MRKTAKRQTSAWMRGIAGLGLAALALLFIAGPVPGSAQSGADPARTCAAVGTRDDLEYIEPSDPAFARLAGAANRNARSLAWRCANGRALTCPASATADCMQPNLSRTPHPATAAFCRNNPNASFVPGSDSDRTSVFAWRCAGRTAVPDRQVVWPGPLDARGFAVKEWTLLAPAPPAARVATTQAATPADAMGPPRGAPGYTLPVPLRGRVWGYFDPEYLRDEDRQHLGLDLPADARDPVVSPVTGVVITDKTDNPDTMQAYMVIREDGTGVEHVLGHVRSTVGLVRVERGKPVATVRDWGERSHVHWGANRLGVAQALNDKWGWGRAPAGATRQKAEARGWIDLTPYLRTSAAPAPTSTPSPTAPAAPAGWRAMTLFRGNLSRGQTAGAWAFQANGRLLRSGQLIATVPEAGVCDIYSSGSLVALNCFDSDGGASQNLPHVLLREGRVIAPNLLRVTQPGPQSPRCAGRSDCYALTPEHLMDFHVSEDGRFLLARGRIGEVGSGVLARDLSSGASVFVPGPHEFTPEPDRWDGMSSWPLALHGGALEIRPVSSTRVEVRFAFECGGPVEPQQLALCKTKTQRIVRNLQGVRYQATPDGAEACCLTATIDLSAMTFDFPALRGQRGWRLPSFAAAAPAAAAAPPGDPSVPALVRTALNVRYPGWVRETNPGTCDANWRSTLLSGDFNRDGAKDFLIKIRRGRNIYAVALLAAAGGFTTHEVGESSPDLETMGIQVLKRGERYQDYSANRQRTAEADTIHIAACEVSSWLMIYRNGAFTRLHTSD